MASSGELAGTLVLIDGFNVLHAGVLRGRDRARWWEPGARLRLLEVVARFPRKPSETVVVVFDGRESDEPEPPSIEPSIEVVRAPSADDWIAGKAKEVAGFRPVVVVTADRDLLRRVKELGAEHLPPRTFLAACDRGSPRRR
jgi:predicted RNA-binding protein with PIN domain